MLGCNGRPARAVCYNDFRGDVIRRTGASPRESSTPTSGNSASVGFSPTTPGDPGKLKTITLLDEHGTGSSTDGTDGPAIVMCPAMLYHQRRIPPPNPDSFPSGPSCSPKSFHICMAGPKTPAWPASAITAHRAYHSRRW